MTTSIDIRKIREQLRGTRFGREETLHALGSVGSTNTVALQAAAQGAPEGSVFLAEEQTAGRGRGGHAWVSPPGEGLYVSVLLRPALAAGDVLWLSLIAGLAARDAVARVTGRIPDLRWPNDLLLDEKKVGGILTEISADAQQVRHAVIGMGLNVNQTVFYESLQGAATSLRLASGREWPREELLAALLQSLDAEYSALHTGGGSEATRSVRRRFEAGCSLARGVRVRVEDHGAPAFTGITAGLDARGFLQVETEAGMRTVMSGGVRPAGTADQSCS
jgi:BirA family biotin operon repressor/biotin-[acetyl-CoA-carboxylase] ligase